MTVSTNRTPRLFSGGVICIAGAAAITVGYFVPGVCLLFLAFYIVIVRELDEWQEKNRVAAKEEGCRKVAEILREDFAALDVISQDVRWLGAESLLVCFKYPFLYERKFHQQILARTNKGVWFVVDYTMDLLEIQSRSVSPVDEATVKSWLAHDRDAYIKFFGLPATA